MNNTYKSLTEYYPTPPALMAKMFQKVDLTNVKTILEPSAGDGNLVEFCNLVYKYTKDYDYKFYRNSYNKEHNSDGALSKKEVTDKIIETECVKEFLKGDSYYTNYNFDFDCIEPDKNLRSILENKNNVNLVGDDFLHFSTNKLYDLIIMNPPFSDGAKHLLHAIRLGLKGGSQIVCLLNAETIRNPYSNERKDLVNQLNKYGASFEYVKNAFNDENCERKTDVEVVIVSVKLPSPFSEDRPSFFWDNLEKKEYELDIDESCTDLVVDNFIKQAVALYNKEIECGKQMISEFFSVKKHFSVIFEKENDERFYLKGKTTLSLSCGDKNSEDYSAAEMFNEFVKRTRQKYWSELLSNPAFYGNLTSDLKSQYNEQVNELVKYDFNIKNICDVKLDILQKTAQGIQDAILKLFEELTYKHSMGCENNIHYFNGWKTNDAFMINNKVVVPCYDVYDNIFKKFKYTYGDMYNTLSDIEKIFDYFDGGETTVKRKLSVWLRWYDEDQVTKNLEFTYFTVNVYKKGTIHIKFKDEELLKKFNIYGCMRKGWLPPTYGKKAYEDMTQEEQEVIDSFQGEAEYNKVFENRDNYILAPENSVFLLNSQNETSNSVIENDFEDYESDEKQST